MKRVLVDGWEISRALEEATQLGLSNVQLRQFLLDEIEKRKRARRAPADNLDNSRGTRP